VVINIGISSSGPFQFFLKNYFEEQQKAWHAEKF